MFLSSECVARLLMDMEDLRVVCISSLTPLERTNFSFASGFQLHIASGIGDNVMILC